jgi:hypothetical protein
MGRKHTVPVHTVKICGGVRGEQNNKINVNRGWLK